MLQEFKILDTNLCLHWGSFKKIYLTQNILEAGGQARLRGHQYV